MSAKERTNETTEVIEISLLELSIAQAEWTFEATTTHPRFQYWFAHFSAVNLIFHVLVALNGTYHVRKMLATLHVHFTRAWADPIISHRMVTKRSRKLFNNGHIDESNQLSRKIFHLRLTKEVFLEVTSSDANSIFKVLLKLRCFHFDIKLLNLVTNRIDCEHN